MGLGHSRNVRRMVSPCSYAVDRLDHAEMGHIAGASGEEIFACRVARGWRVRRQRKAGGEA